MFGFVNASQSVSDQMMLIGKIFATFFTCIRFCIVMHIHVVLIVTKLYILLITYTTHIHWLVTMFYQLMSVQGTSVIKGHCALITNQFDVFMNTFYMLAKVIHLSILFSTLLALYFVFLVDGFPVP